MQTKKEWAGDDLRESLKTLMGRKVVLIGRGAIHKQLLAYLAPFQCEISLFGSDYNTAELEQALKQADILVSTVPATPQTNNILDAVRLALLPKHAIFLNFGRSNIVDTPAMIQMLETEQLAGAVLDVTDDEPCSGKNHPLGKRVEEEVECAPDLARRRHSRREGAIPLEWRESAGLD